MADFGMVGLDGTLCGRNPKHVQSLGQNRRRGHSFARNQERFKPYEDMEWTGDTRHRTGEGRTASLSEASSGPHRQCSSDITLRPKSAVPATKSSKTPMTPLRPSIDAGSSSYLATVVWLPSSWRLCLSSRYPPVHSLDLACHRPNGHVHRQSFGHPPQSPVLAPAALYP